MQWGTREILRVRMEKLRNKRCLPVTFCFNCCNGPLEEYFSFGIFFSETEMLDRHMRNETYEILTRP